MNRKRFVKLLMSIGYDRNVANGAALFARMQRIPYEKMWRVYQINHYVKKAKETLSDGLRRLGTEVSKAVEQLAKMNKIWEVGNERKDY